jgi:cyclophilin family peptidyl-prolyl cis-trans isomerase
MLLALIVPLFTSAGEIDINVDQAHASKTSANFLAYVRRGAYDGGSFFRFCYGAATTPERRAR